MKYLTAIGLVLLFAVPVLNGQPELGKTLIGGETRMSFSTISSMTTIDGTQADNGKTADFEFSPQVGHFVSNKLVLGAEIPIKYILETSVNNIKKSTTSLAFAPFARYYFGTGNLRPFLDGEIGFGTMAVKYKYDYGRIDKVSAGMFMYVLGGGLAVFLNEIVSVDFEVGYSSVSAKTNEDNETVGQNNSSGIGLGIGFVFLL